MFLRRRRCISGAETRGNPTSHFNLRFFQCTVDTPRRSVRGALTCVGTIPSLFCRQNRRRLRHDLQIQGAGFHFVRRIQIEVQRGTGYKAVHWESAIFRTPPPNRRCRPPVPKEHLGSCYLSCLLTKLKAVGCRYTILQ